MLSKIYFQRKGGSVNDRNSKCSSCVQCLDLSVVANVNGLFYQTADAIVDQSLEYIPFVVKSYPIFYIQRATNKPFSTVKCWYPLGKEIPDLSNLIVLCKGTFHSLPKITILSQHEYSPTMYALSFWNTKLCKTDFEDDQVYFFVKLCDCIYQHFFPHTAIMSNVVINRQEKKDDFQSWSVALALVQVQLRLANRLGSECNVYPSFEAVAREILLIYRQIVTNNRVMSLGQLQDKFKRNSHILQCLQPPQEKEFFSQIFSRVNLQLEVLNIAMKKVIRQLPVCYPQQNTINPEPPNLDLERQIEINLSSVNLDSLMVKLNQRHDPQVNNNIDVLFAQLDVNKMKFNNGQLTILLDENCKDDAQTLRILLRARFLMVYTPPGRFNFVEVNYENQGQRFFANIAEEDISKLYIPYLRTSATNIILLGSNITDETDVVVWHAPNDNLNPEPEQNVMIMKYGQFYVAPRIAQFRLLAPECDQNLVVLTDRKLHPSPAFLHSQNGFCYQVIFDRFRFPGIHFFTTISLGWIRAIQVIAGEDIVENLAWFHEIQV